MFQRRLGRRILVVLILALAALPALGGETASLAQTLDADGITPDMVARVTDSPKDFTQPQTGFDYVRRTVEIPMRDGVTLHTVIVLPKGARDLPILLTRTPYHADERSRREPSPTMVGVLPQGDSAFVRDGYIRVFQDVRGTHGSGGDYVMTRPPIGPLNPSDTDDTTDAYDTIDWLVRNVAESNRRVGMLGSSYEGWTVVMALLHPHPALKVAAPESPMVDGWMGDDWFHYGAFRQTSLDFFSQITSHAGSGMYRHQYDDYTAFLEKGSAGAWASQAGLDQIGFWNRLSSHPAYDAFWRLQALDQQVAAHPSDVPTMWIQGLWDQEDIWGAVHSWTALKAAGHGANNYLVMGPWRHSQVNYAGLTLGPLTWRGDTAGQFRQEVLLPFFDRYLKDQPQATPPAHVQIYNTSENHWDALDDWPGAAALTPLYLQDKAGLGFDKPPTGVGSDAGPDRGARQDSYVADPAKPVPFLPRPIAFSDDVRWKTWLVQDQRFVSDRPDVLVYQTPVLTAPVRLQGAPIADLFAKTSGTDADWVVKLIDVFPGETPDDPKMGGYELAVSLDIFRGRYRKAFDKPSPIPAGQIQEYRFALPSVDHVFLPGHRIMVQIQSSLFPLYDRNPQTYVPNIFFAKPADYAKATVSVMRDPAHPSAVLLPVVETSDAAR